MCDEQQRNAKIEDMYRGKQWSPLPGAAEMGQESNVTASGRTLHDPSDGNIRTTTPGNRTLDTLHKLRFQAERHLKDVTRALEIATANPQILDNIEFEDIMRRLGMR